MNSSAALRRSSTGWGFAVTMVAVVLYFGYFAVYGNHGLLSWIRLRHSIEAQQTELASIRKERMALERRVRLMRPESVDPDMLDEQARVRLGLSLPDEVVILRETP